MSSYPITFVVGDRVEWEDNDWGDDGRLCRTIMYGTVIPDEHASPWALSDRTLVRPDRGDGDSLVKTLFLRLATMPGLRDALTQALHEGCVGELGHSWQWDYPKADAAIAALVRGHHITQPQCPIVTVSISGTATTQED